MGISISTKGLSKDSCLLSGYFLVSLQAIAVWKVANTTNNLQLYLHVISCSKFRENTSTRVYIERGFGCLRLIAMELRHHVSIGLLGDKAACETATDF